MTEPTPPMKGVIPYLNVVGAADAAELYKAAFAAIEHRRMPAEDGKRFFEVAYGLREREPEEALGLIYSRINNPNLEVLEDRLAVWDGAEKALAFASGMAAISTTLMTFLRPGDSFVFSEPVYGGTEFLVHTILPQFGATGVGFMAEGGEAGFREAAKQAAALAAKSGGGCHRPD